MQAIYLDMDGTIADLYAIPGWLEYLQNGDTTPYRNAAPMYDMVALNDILQSAGVTIGVISWGAKNATREYNRRIRKAKKAWIDKYLPCVSEFHVVKYGTPKHTVAKIKNSILIDDNAEVRQAWKNGETISATSDFIAALCAIIKEKKEQKKSF